MRTRTRYFRHEYPPTRDNTYSCFYSFVLVNNCRLTKWIILKIKSETKSTRCFSNHIVFVICLHYHEHSKTACQEKQRLRGNCLSCILGRSETRQHYVQLNPVAIFRHILGLGRRWDLSPTSWVSFHQCFSFVPCDGSTWGFLCPACAAPT
jgi:hypothetical protein